MKLKALSFALGMVVVFALAGCGPSPATPTPTPVITPTGVMPTCAGASLVAPVISGPAHLSVVASLTPTLSWSYPDPTCKPTGYQLHFAMGPLYTPELGGSVGTATSFTPGTPLQPGKVYELKVSAVSGGTVGPASDRRIFYTGPVCAAGGMTAPALFEPVNGATVNNPSSMMEKWDSTGGCIPTGYHLDLATDPAFTTIVEADDNTVALNRAVWGDPNPFVDCTRYYWRVAQKVGDAVGPFSETWTYRIDINGTCAPEAPASFSGVVWNDANADSIRQAGESGRPGVVVNLGAGDCPAFSFIQSTTTAADGSYAFTGLLPGNYCMEIDPIADISVGHFTLSASGKEGRAYRAVEVYPGQTLTGQDFGWYQTGQNVALASVSGMVWNDQCFVAPDANPVPSPLPSGCVVDGNGVDADGIRQAGESGLPDVTVSIGPGDCPLGMPTAQTQTGNGIDGSYTISDLLPGNYCLEVDPLVDQGHFTLGASGHEGKAYRAITLVSGQVLTGQDFGWYFKPSSGAQITLDLNAYCHSGPALWFSSSAVGTAGAAYPIVGISPDLLWYYVKFNANLRCWFAKGVGKTSGDLGTLPPGPTPVPTPVPPSVVDCSKYSSQRTCEADAACTWVPAVIRAPYCANK